MAEHKTGDQSLMPATSEKISGLITVITHGPPKRGKTADLALPDHQRAANTESADGKFQSSASREILQSDLDINTTGDGIESRDDMPVINGRSSSISPRDAHKELQCKPFKKMIKWAGRSNSSGQLEEGEGEGEGEGEEEEEEGGESACVTPRATEQRIPHEILICPPPPRKKRRISPFHCRRIIKRLSNYIVDDAVPRPPSAPQYLGLLAAEQLQVVVNPPDLHTFPECIRALFFHN